MELITGTAKTPHVTSTQHRSIYEMIIGEGSYILGKGELLKPELQSNNVLRIRSGMLCHHGSISEVKQNTYDEVNIGNGSQGMKRIDLVVARYTKNPETEIETMTWEVIQGTPAADSPVAPAYTEGNMQDGDLTDDCPLFEVHLDGIQVTEVVKLLEVLNGSLAELNSKSINIGINSETVDTSFGYIRATQSGKVVVVSAAVRVRAAIGTYSGMTLATGLPNPLGGALQGSALSKDGTYASCVFEVGADGGLRLDSRFQAVSSGDTFLGQIVYLCQ